MIIVLQHALQIFISTDKLALDANQEKYGMEIAVSVDVTTVEYGVLLLTPVNVLLSLTGMDKDVFLAIMGRSGMQIQRLVGALINQIGMALSVLLVTQDKSGIYLFLAAFAHPTLNGMDYSASAALMVKHGMRE
jgi:hypothetical protein